jgi:hypothetical protein
MGVKSQMNLVLFCESRPEWLISALSCFRINVPGMLTNDSAKRKTFENIFAS